jgi:hypothetical protein
MAQHPRLIKIAKGLSCCTASPMFHALTPCHHAIMPSFFVNFERAAIHDWCTVSSMTLEQLLDRVRQEMQARAATASLVPLPPAATPIPTSSEPALPPVSHPTGVVPGMHKYMCGVCVWVPLVGPSSSTTFSWPSNQLATGGGSWISRDGLIFGSHRSMSCSV